MAFRKSFAGAIAVAALSLLTATSVSAAVKNGGSCSKIGQLATVKQKKKSVDFICTQEGKRRVWRLRPGGAIGGTPGGAVTAPGGATGGGTTGTTVPGGTTGGGTTATTVPGGTTGGGTTAKPGETPGGTATSADCDKATYKATNSGTNNYVGCDHSVTYSELGTTSGTSITSGQSAVGFMSMPGSANESGGALFFNHPAGMATDGTRLAIADRNNNRVLVWTTAPTANTAPNIVLGQPNFNTNNSGSALNEMNWPSDLSISASGMLMVADSNNHRILIWRTFPTTSGQAADLSLDLGGSSWPWGVWTDGTKIMVSRTEGGDIKVWNSVPATSGQTAASFTIDPDVLGTPRQITSDGSRLIIGDENSRSPLGSRGSHVWNSFPTSSSSNPDYFMLFGRDKSAGWYNGHIDSTGVYLLQRDLEILRTFPTSNPSASELAVAPPDVGLQGGDGGDVAKVGNRLYVLEYNASRIAAWNAVPTTANQAADFYVGSSGPADNSNRAQYMITNPVMASDGTSLAINSDFERRVYVWKKIPGDNNAKPDLSFIVPFQPWDSVAATFKGTKIYAIAGEGKLHIWSGGIPLSSSTFPSTQLDTNIGGIAMSGLTAVAADTNYIYVADKKSAKVYVFNQIPTATSAPVFTLPGCAAATQLRSDGNYLVLSCLDGMDVYVWTVGALADNQSGRKVTGTTYNGTMGGLPANGGLFIADTGFDRVVWWSSMSAALSGGAPTAVLGASTAATKANSGLGINKLRMPRSLLVQHGYLWVGEQKFGNRILRFKLG